MTVPRYHGFPSIRSLLLAALLPGLGACGGVDSGGPNGPPGNLPARKLGLAVAPPATAASGVLFATQPTVQLLDSLGAAVTTSGVVVTVAVDGGGLVGTASVSTGTDGRARFTSLAVSGTAGSHTLTFSAGSLTPVGHAFTLTAGPAAKLTPVTATTQIAPAGTLVPVAPAVRVTDAANNPVAGAAVTFSLTGEGQLTGTTAVSGADGIATLGSWTAGASAGVVTVSAALAGVQAATVSFTTTVTLQPSASQFDIEVRDLSGLPPAQWAIVSAAAARWAEVIVGDKPANRAQGLDICFDGQAAMDEMVDDIVIFVRTVSFDGPGGALAAAGPCAIRGAGFIPYVGIIEIDASDLPTLNTAIVQHEIAHALGFGSIWTDHGLLGGGGTTDPFFGGAQATQRYIALGGVANGAGVPVEGSAAGPGTADSHWRESVLKNELMTGFVQAGANPLTAITIGAMADIGYQVDFATAEAFTVTPSAGLAAGAPSVPLREWRISRPVTVGRPDGSVLRRVPRP